MLKNENKQSLKLGYKLNKDMFTRGVEQKPTRDGFGHGLVQAGVALHELRTLGGKIKGEHE